MAASKAPEKAPNDPFAQGAFKRAGKLRSEMRKLVCVGCMEPSDIVLGKVHSESTCHRCKRTPCGYGVVVTIR